MPARFVRAEFGPPVAVRTCRMPHAMLIFPLLIAMAAVLLVALVMLMVLVPTPFWLFMEVSPEVRVVVPDQFVLVVQVVVHEV